MSPSAPASRPAAHEAPPANRSLLAVAGVLLALPIIALMLVGTYARKGPALGDFPFFIWYQFLWVFLCSGCTIAAYVIVRKARPHRPMTDDGVGFLDGPEAPDRPGAAGRTGTTDDKAGR